MPRQTSDREAIEAEIDRVRPLGLDELRTLWRTTFRSSPPPAFTKDLLALEREVTAEYEPTADQRALVESASAFGITQAEIANQLGIDEKTLRKHFRVELNSGKFKVDMTAGKTLVELMKSRDERV